MMTPEALAKDNAALGEALAQCARERTAYEQASELKRKRLYARVDRLEALLKHHSIPVPDWEGGA